MSTEKPPLATILDLTAYLLALIEEHGNLPVYIWSGYPQDWKKACTAWEKES